MITHVCKNRNYLRAVCLLLLTSLKAGATYQAIATSLNGIGLFTPTGNPWQVTHVKNLLRKIRNPRRYVSVFRLELDACIAEGLFNADYCKPLTEFYRGR